jgi:hypothetical protein
MSNALARLLRTLDEDNIAVAAVTGKITSSYLKLHWPCGDEEKQDSDEVSGTGPGGEQ